MTEHQIKGCQTLAEVEGWELDQPSTDYCRQNVFRRGDNWKYYYDFYNYLHDWNDLHRVAEIIFNHPVKHWCGRQSAKKAFLMSVSNFSKESAFIELVEAAEWIKQNKNG